MGNRSGTMVYESEGDPSGNAGWRLMFSRGDGGVNWGAALSSGAQYIRDWEWDVRVDVGVLQSHPDRFLRGTREGGWLLLMPRCLRISRPAADQGAWHGVVPKLLMRRDAPTSRMGDDKKRSDTPNWERIGRNADISAAVTVLAVQVRLVWLRSCATICPRRMARGFCLRRRMRAVASRRKFTELLVRTTPSEARRGLVARAARKLRAREFATRIVDSARCRYRGGRVSMRRREQGGTVLE